MNNSLKLKLRTKNLKRANNNVIDKRKQIIEIVPYDLHWPKLFKAEAALIKPIFTDNFITLHHIGSTAIPGMPAKPKKSLCVLLFYKQHRNEKTSKHNDTGK